MCSFWFRDYCESERVYLMCIKQMYGVFWNRFQFKRMLWCTFFTCLNSAFSIHIRTKCRWYINIWIFPQFPTSSLSHLLHRSLSSFWASPFLFCLFGSFFTIMMIIITIIRLLYRSTCSFFRIYFPFFLLLLLVLLLLCYYDLLLCMRIISFSLFTFI